MLQIGEIARLLGVTPKTVRHYHKLGLIREPARSKGGYRLYSASDLIRLQHIRRLQSLGLSLQQIKAILDAPDPDSTLHEMLAKLREEIMRQQMKLEARRRNIETYLAEEVSLREVVQPDGKSETFKLMENQLGEMIEASHPLIELDRQIFAQMDSFEWGEDYQKQWQLVAEYFAAHPDDYRLLTALGEKIAALANLPVDAPEIELWAREFAENGVLQRLAGLSLPTSPMESNMELTLGQVIQHAAAETLSPAQMRFMELLGKVDFGN